MMRVDLTKMQVAAIVTMLRDDLGEDDDALKLDTLEGETNLFEISSRILNQIENEEGVKAALVSQIQDRNERKARAEKRIETYRLGLRSLMEAAELDKLPLPEATVTLRKVAPKAIVTDETLLPDALCKITRKPDMAAIKAIPDPAALPGISLDNGGISLTIRRR